MLRSILPLRRETQSSSYKALLIVVAASQTVASATPNVHLTRIVMAAMARMMTLVILLMMMAMMTMMNMMVMVVVSTVVVMMMMTTMNGDDDCNDDSGHGPAHLLIIHNSMCRYAGFMFWIFWVASVGCVRLTACLFITRCLLRVVASLLHFDQA